MQNISLQSSGMRRKQNFSTAVLTFTFRFLSSPFFFYFSYLIFFSFAGHVVGFILGEKFVQKLLGS